MGSSALILFCWEVGRGRGIVMGVLSFLLDFGLLGEWDWKRWMALADLAGGVGDGGSSLHCWGVFLGSSGFFCCFELLGLWMAPLALVRVLLGVARILLLLGVGKRNELWN